MNRGKDYDRMIHSDRWKKLRAKALIACPYCVSCQLRGKRIPATEVHHAVPVETATDTGERERLMFDVKNLRCLCHDCHVEAHKALRSSAKGTSRKRGEEEAKSLAERLWGCRKNTDGGPVF